MSKNFSKYVNNFFVILKVMLQESPHSKAVLSRSLADSKDHPFTKTIYFSTFLTEFLTKKLMNLNYYNKQKTYFKQINMFYYYCYIFIYFKYLEEKINNHI